MRILGLDFGETYLGIALGEGRAVTPLTPINNKNWDTAVLNLAKIVIASKVEKIVLGQIEPPSPLVDKFAALLKRRLRLPVILVREDFSSQEALNRSLELGIASKKRQHLDSLAAAIILERYLLESESPL
jgi:putative transcription antitermination factor YqgF